MEVIMKQVQESKAEIWRKHIESAKVFPGCAREYCERHSLQVQSFYQWKKKLSLLSDVQQSNFAPVVVSGLERDSARANLPDARWAAEFAIHFLRGLR
jgi:hypothetical protein